MNQLSTPSSNLQTLPAVTPPDMLPQRSKLFLILLFLICALLFSAVLVFAYENFLVPKLRSTALSSTMPSIMPLVSPSSQPVSNIPADWKTYTNEKWRYSFKYPAVYFKYSIQPPGVDNAIYLAPKEGTGEEKGSPMGLSVEDVWLYVDATMVSQTVSLEDFINQRGITSTNRKNITISGTNGYKIIQQTFGPQNIVSYIGIVDIQSNIYVINLSAFNMDALSGKEKIFDQILSTFKFVELPSSNP